MAAPPLKHRRALITGASAGIGEAFARVFAEHGFDLVLVARSGGKLNQLASELKRKHNVGVHTFTCDLNAPNACEHLYRYCHGLEIGVLVNNAGVMYHGHFIEQPASNIDTIVQLNIASLTQLTRCFLPDMLEQGSGRILNVTSTSGFMPGPTIAVYAASKAYILSFTEAIAEEIRGSGVYATAFGPGFTDTDMAADSFGEDIKSDPFSAFLMMGVEEVAREGYRACMEGDVVSIPGVANNLLNTINRLQPKWMSRRVQAYLYRNFLDGHGS